MTPEARHQKKKSKFPNGHAHSYRKNKVDTLGETRKEDPETGLPGLRSKTSQIVI